MALYIRCGCLGFFHQHQQNFLSHFKAFQSGPLAIVLSQVMWMPTCTSLQDSSCHLTKWELVCGTSWNPLALEGMWMPILEYPSHDVQGHCNCWPTLTNRKWRASKMWMTWGIFWISEQRYIYVVTPTKTSWSIYHQLHYKKREGRFSKNFKVIIWNSFVPLFGEFLHWNFSTNFKFLFYIIPALVQMEKKHSQQNWLVVEPTPLKNMLVKMGIFPNFRGENKKYGWNHHTENHAANRCTQNPPIHQILQLLSFV